MFRGIDQKLKPLAARIAGLLLLLMLLAAPAQAENAGEPVRRFTVGDLTVLAINDGPLSFASTLYRGIENDPPKMALMPGGSATAVTNTFVIRTGEQVILVDGGWGSEFETKGQTPEHLLSAGIKPEEVTDIFLTHMDIDHIAGLINQGRAVYPAARLHISGLEHDSWIVRGVDREPEYVELARKVLAAYDGHLDLFTFGQEVAPGVTALPAVGHTAGHTMYLLSSGGRTMSIVGDAFHAFALQLKYPEENAVYDVYPNQAALTRRNILERLSESDGLMAGMHFGEIGQVRKLSGGGFEIVPVK